MNKPGLGLQLRVREVLVRRLRRVLEGPVGGFLRRSRVPWPRFEVTGPENGLFWSSVVELPQLASWFAKPAPDLAKFAN